MVGMPAHCDVCGATFISNAIQFEDAFRVNIRSTVMCPRGHIAHGIDGTFDFVNGAIQAHNASPRTIAILAALQGAFRAAQSGKPEEEIVEEIRSASPEVATFVASLMKTGHISLAVILLVLLKCCSVHLEATLDVNELFNQVRGCFGESAQSAPAPTHKATPAPNRHHRRAQERQSRKPGS
jgi:hypothetical protein